MVIMNTSLHYDICDLRDPSVQNAEVKDLSERIGRYILPELLYACKFWKAHLELMIDDSPALAEIQSFVLTKLLPWIECLSILFSISVALPALGVAQLWCTVRSVFCAPCPHVHAIFSTEIWTMRLNVWRASETLSSTSRR
jgi:hypothetical protein